MMIHPLLLANLWRENGHPDAMNSPSCCLNHCRLMNCQHPTIRSERLLIVDDTAFNQKILTHLLDKVGYQVTAVSNAAAALTMIKLAPPDLILLDICMPEMDGYELCQILKSDPTTCEIPILFISALNEVEHKIQAFKFGGVDYITKPFHVEEVLARIDTHITLRRLHHQLQAQNERLQAEVRDRLAAEAALRVANRELFRMAHLDGLTQVANRRCFDESLERDWKILAVEKAPLALILCDVDFFKCYNDTYGHQAGDRCLCEVAQAIQSYLRPCDMVARYGGEEFVVILPDTSLEAAIQIAQGLQDQIRELDIEHLGSPIHRYITLSLGIAGTVPQSTIASAQLVAAADRALYQAKSEGRNCIVAQQLLNNGLPQRYRFGSSIDRFSIPSE